jgi:hypothetical protein
MATTVSNGNGTDVVSLLKKNKPPALKKLASWKDENEFDSNPKTPRTSTTPGTYKRARSGIFPRGSLARGQTTRLM